MTLDPDPYRTLGLTRGASLDEVKRAYRRLAKVNHPDAAGEAALPRFLAIQAAYEQLVGGAGPSAPGRRPAPTPRRPWEADPDRSDATRRAYGGRARNAAPGGDGSRTEPRGRPSATTDGAKGGPADPGRTRWSSRAEAPGGTSPRPGQRRSSPPRDGDGTGRPGGPDGPTRRTGRPGGPGGSGRTPADGPPNKATLGSTSYDGVEGPFEPDWGGASWYGTTSGTYWTLNPKEYADPRKHGPEYQARARRTARSRGSGPNGPVSDGAAADSGAEADPDAAADSGAGTAFEPGPGPSAGPTHTTTSWWESTTGDATGPAADPATHARRPTHDGAHAAHAADAADAPTPPDLGRALTDIVRALTEPRFGGLRGRVIRAVIGWLPIALGLGWVVGELTGCGRFAATCDGSADVRLLGLQVAVLIALLLLPALASVATMAALTVFAASVATAFILSATGGAADSDSRRAALGIVLLLAWLLGLSIAIGRRLRALPTPTSPVS